jgi:DNA-binding CsgD family transcriptional regulator
MAKKPQGKKLCFVVGPIGSADSDERIHADWLLEEIIEPVFEEHFKDFRVERADRVANPGKIETQMITALLEAELVIADLTTLNPNAFYEIGIRHAIQKPIIHMHLTGTLLPFDVAPFRSIEFNRKRPSDIKAARADLRAYVDRTSEPEFEVDNPVTFSRGRVEFDKSATPVDKLLQEELDSLKSRIASLEGKTETPTFHVHDTLSFVRPTKRELEILDLTAKGLTSEDIATKLDLSIHTVNQYLANTVQKMGATNRSNAIALAFQRGLLK